MIVSGALWRGDFLPDARAAVDAAVLAEGGLVERGGDMDKRVSVQAFPISE